ncbi:MAG TPA: cobyric acid synthase [Geminicoccus sp.]|jgi:adenosylcobyric acid synthase|uniref:cobyric acid synthase n=1 Tax=Geminicoccus sp. TaxID=2024832 RepID=UPI002E333216|nr:cobyric acid synthase [Geminicoccus sp.]HEX2525714.1 cobyric acid synthase [Geminicoccus sp.]
MIQGTCSNAGKSLVVAGLCRAFTRRGLSVRPFKPQNMSNNAAPAADGGEIGRAQALQARACHVPPSVHMNPVLLKPETDCGSQVVVQGRMVGRVRAGDYYGMKPSLLPSVLESFARLGDEADLVLVEGAGSPAEVNLRSGDIANMGFAQAAQVPVVLVGDIERGGVIAQLVGTWELLDPDERALVKGYIVNKFRGDPRLFDTALPILAARTGLRSFGTVTWCDAAADLPKEDMLGLAEIARERPDARIVVAVPRLPRLSNLDDLDPLAQEPSVRLVIVEPGAPIGADADLVLLPGSKATVADLAFLRAQGWHIDIQAHVRRGGHVLGLCGGYQMLGRSIADPLGLEGPPAEVEGLGLLDVATELDRTKTVRETTAIDLHDGTALHGYEIHLGRTTGPGLERPMIRIDGHADGAVSPDGRVAGCYLHGLLGNDGWRARYLRSLDPSVRSALDVQQRTEAALDGLAAHLEACLDLDELLAVARPVGTS